MIQGFLVALVAALVYMESRIGGQHMLDRPDHHWTTGWCDSWRSGDRPYGRWLTGTGVDGSCWYWNIHTTRM